ncbi:MAG: DUF4349 domain-containing protein [Dehalococcoidales bacterium]|nr:DUF4349 domain-containing protein [Dehalococcoidales bacterium]
MKIKVFIVFAIILMAITIFSCSAKTSIPGTYPKTEGDYSIETIDGYYPAPIITLTTQASKYEDNYATGSGEVVFGSPEFIERMIVRTGNMAIVVEDIQAIIARITQIAGEHQGYVVSSQSWKEGQILRGTISIRIIASDYDAVVSLISGLAVDVTSQTTSSQDVTEEYIDLAAQLSNLQATEQQLLLVMSKAETVEDILAVQRELTNTRDSIERTQARMQYLERTSSTSLLNIQLEQSKLRVEFNANNTIVKVGKTVYFRPDIAGGFAPYTYEWDFGDGKTSNETAPTHLYNKSGNYTVTLKVTDDRQNSETIVRKDYITVQPGWSAGSVAGSAWNGLVTFGHVLANIFIWLGYFSPVWIIGLVIWYLIYRRRKKKASH